MNERSIAAERRCGTVVRDVCSTTATASCAMQPCISDA
ncbi:hypothetical protein PXO_01455 [Xanthomonas oryzae pv. oryzae PXO99A]|uniref:Uncharacterized protein n=1 Tax=Xanthomonas oryzae pv. oryzae (strain PXO99A) TaxID=360094 RepID=A0A0K0GMA8_XANOP|nr:hypothetical protein PXO_01455 [Xanthomonas oryzae pv. oryzae PXO99A]